MAVRVSVFHDGLRFNESLGGGEDPIGGEDSEMVSQLNRLGHRPVYLPRSAVHHQIRQDQLTMRWLHRRAFHGGRTLAFVSGLPHPSSQKWNIMKATFRMVGYHGMRYIKWLLLMNKSERIQHGLLISHHIGKAYQYRLGVPKERLVDYD